MRIGVISDTHGVLHPRVAEVFAGVGHIVHAGDVGGEHIAEALERLAPVTAVRGNNDDSNGFEVLRLTLDGLRILVTHVLPRPSAPGKHVLRSLSREPADVVIFGHSHLPHDEIVGEIRFLNPGSAGARRFNYPTSVAILENGRAWHVPLDERSVAALAERMNQME